jgi:hypothetical protein
MPERYQAMVDLGGMPSSQERTRRAVAAIFDTTRSEPSST